MVAAVCVKWIAATRVLSPHHLPVLPLVEIQSEQVLSFLAALCSPSGRCSASLSFSLGSHSHGPHLLELSVIYEPQTDVVCLRCWK